MALARTVVEEDEVAAAFDAASAQYPRLEELWEAWKWRLARGPEIEGVMVPGSNPPAYIVKTYDFSDFGMPSATTILYTFDPNETRILGVKFSTPPAAVQMAA